MRCDDTLICVCGHTAYWHGNGGGGMCEHDQDCRCGEFTHPAEIHDACGRPFAAHSEDGHCPFGNAIRHVLAAYRSTEAHVTGVEIERAWTELEGMRATEAELRALQTAWDARAEDWKVAANWQRAAEEARSSEPNRRRGLRFPWR